MRIQADDFRTADGLTDWDAYTKARIANGELCKECTRYVSHSAIFEKLGHPQHCSDCDSLYRQGAVSHTRRIRCPHCGACQPSPEGIDIYKEEYEAYCDMCEKDFTVAVSVTVTFTSPKMDA